MDNLSDQDPGLIAITLVYKLIITLFNMAATARQERELKTKYQKLLKDPSLTPLEKLRAYVMSKGTRSLKSLHR